MPHKRAKRSARDKQKNLTGSDHAPVSNSLSQEPIPKSVARVLNAAQVQEEWRAKKRKAEVEDQGGPGPDGGKKKRKTNGESGAEGLKIQQGESLTHFNKRVEFSMRGTVVTAMQASAAHMRKAKKKAEDTKGKTAVDSEKPQTVPLKPSGATSSAIAEKKEVSDRQKRTEFTRLSTSAPRRLNDIVQAPPEFKKLPRGAKTKVQLERSDALSKSGNLQEGASSMARKVMLEEERERAVRAYRKLKKQNTGGA